MKRRYLIPVALLAMMLLSRVSAVDTAPSADDRSAAQLLPASTLVYVEIPEPKKLIELVFDHPMRKKLEAMDQYKTFKASPQYTQLMAGVAIFEKQVDMKWREAIEAVAGGGMTLAFDPTTQGVVILIKADDLKKMEQVRDGVFNFVRATAGKNDPLKPNNYRGIDTYKGPGGQGGMAIHGKWIILTNNKLLGQQVLDTIVDNPKNTLATDKEFVAAKAMATGRTSGSASAGDLPTVWTFARIAGVREAGLLSALMKEKSDNPGAELILGGLQETLKHANYATAALRLKNDEIRMTLAAPHDHAKVPKVREYFFAPHGQGAPRPLKVEGAALSITTYRDISAMFKSADELFEEGIAAGIANADSQISLFFGGRKFYGEVIGALKPQMQFIVARQNFKDITPGIKLPAFAMAARLKKNDPTTIAQFKAAFQSIVGFANIQGTMDGRAMLVPDMDKIDGATLLWASYLLDDKKTDPKKADIYYNFSPAMAIVGDRVFFCSTKELAEQLIAAAKKQTGSEFVDDNTLLELEGPAVIQMLRDNRDQLIAQNMVSKGNSPETAVAETDLLLELANYVKSSALSLSFKNNAATLDWGVKLSLPK